MSTETQLGKIHVFSSEDSYNTNKNSIGVGDLALLPILDLIHPIGSIYWSTDSTSPATLFGGTWEQIKDRFLLACGDNYANGSVGGEASHVLTINEIPSHTHRIDRPQWYGKDTFNNDGSIYSQNSTVAEHSVSMNTYNTGGSSAHNNMPPYLVAYCWKRVA